MTVVFWCPSLCPQHPATSSSLPILLPKLIHTLRKSFDFIPTTLIRSVRGGGSIPHYPSLQLSLVNQQVGGLNPTPPLPHPPGLFSSSLAQNKHSHKMGCTGDWAGPLPMPFVPQQHFQSVGMAGTESVPGVGRGGSSSSFPFQVQLSWLTPALLFPSCTQRWRQRKKPLVWSGTRMPDRDSYTNGTGNSNGGSGGGGGEELGGAGSGANAGGSDAICRDFLRNVCKRGKRCRYRHPDISEVSNLGVSKNEFIFCHDFQNKECSRLNCRFIHGSKEDEDGYKKTGELPPRLRQKVAAGLGLSPADLPNGKEEVPICRDFLKGDCQRGAKCKFRHLQRDFEFEARGGGGVGGGGPAGPAPASRRHDLYDTYDLPDRGFEDHEPCPKRRRGGGGCPSDGSHFETFEYSLAPPRGLECRLLEEENAMLRKRVEELKKQVSNLLATNEVLLEQNAQFRNQAKVMTLSSTAPATEQTLAPSVGTVTNYNHGIAQTHTTLSSQALQPRPVSQQELVAPTGAPAAPPTNAAPPTAPPPPPPPPHLNPEITPLSAALAQTIAQGMAPPPVSMAPVAVSVAPVAVSMAQPLAGITMSHATTPMVTYPIASQSMRITAMPH